MDDPNPSLVVRPVRNRDREEWLRMRLQLWPHHTREEFAREIDAFLISPSGTPEVGSVCFVAERNGEGALCGFVEVAIRENAAGCTPGRVSYIEGWWVDPDLRGAGIGRMLIDAAEQWARVSGCREMASDAELDNTASHSAHIALGYEIVERVVCFRKSLDQ